ncbi:MAG: hypothetical protein BGO30_08275 [Bacteroidetes bacterium 41-46]|nr:MAG: hypothetical protein BGO30_08275 [Bacteroidetes bacterium 41-46]
METAIIIPKDSFDKLVEKVDTLAKEIAGMKREVRKSDQLFNITVTAKKLGISKPTLHKYIRLHLIDYKLVGNTTYFTQEIIDEFISRKQ